MGILKDIKDRFFDLFVSVKNGNDDKVTPELQLERIKLCANCPNLTDTKQCGLCGCFVEYKTIYADEKCPDNKW